MKTQKCVVALVGSYRKGGMVDSAIDAVLAGAVAAGARVEKIYLIDLDIEFCRNCRVCMQQPGEARGKCVHDDAMAGLLDTLAAADALVLGSPVNFGTVTAITKRFIERLACFAYWPWGAPAPKPRSKERPRRAVVVSSSAAPGFLGRYVFHAVGLLKQCAGLLGAKVVGVLFIGLASQVPHPVLSARQQRRAHRLGQRLVA